MHATPNADHVLLRKANPIHMRASAARRGTAEATNRWCTKALPPRSCMAPHDAPCLSSLPCGATGCWLLCAGENGGRTGMRLDWMSLPVFYAASFYTVLLILISSWSVMSSASLISFMPVLIN